MKTISILIPCYNEQESLPALYKRLKVLTESIKDYKFEILFVNDGSRDNTLKIIKELRQQMIVLIMLIYHEILARKLL